MPTAGVNMWSLVLLSGRARKKEGIGSGHDNPSNGVVYVRCNVFFFLEIYTYHFT